jgi:simple sugar transport system substrate-binding protein
VLVLLSSLLLLLAACATADEEVAGGEAGEGDVVEEGEAVTEEEPADAGTGTEGADTGTEEPAAGGGDVTMVTVPKLTGVSWFDRMETGVDNFAEETGVNAYMQGSGQADSAAQVGVIEDLIASDVQALNVVPFQPDAVESVLAEAQEQGIVVVTHEAPGIENAAWDLEAFRNDEYGRFLMDELATRMGEEGQYAVMVGSLSSATHIAWVEAAIAHQEETYPDMEQVGDIIETGDDSQTAYQRMQELLTAYPDIAGVQGSASTDVVGVGQAVDEAGLSEDIAVVGTSVPNDARAGLESGSIDLIAFWDPADAGYAMNVISQMLLNDEEIEDGMDLGVPGYGAVELDGNVIYGDEAWIAVTADNVDEYDF